MPLPKTPERGRFRGGGEFTHARQCLDDALRFGLGRKAVERQEHKHMRTRLGEPMNKQRRPGRGVVAGDNQPPPFTDDRQPIFVRCLGWKLLVMQNHANTSRGEE